MELVDVHKSGARHYSHPRKGSNLDGRIGKGNLSPVLDHCLECFYWLMYILFKKMVVM